MVQPYTLTPPLMNDIKAQAPQAICELVPQNISRDLLINRTKQHAGARLRRRQTARGRGPTDHLPHASRDPPATLCQRL